MPAPSSHPARRDVRRAGPTATRYAVLCGAFLLPGGLAAQSDLSGVVRDSLAGRPLAGASVQLVPAASPGQTPRTVEADSAGRYHLAGVAPGRYLLGFAHPRLDSLGMEAPPRTVDVAPGAGAVAADLALPSAGTIAAALCGGARDRRDSTGVLLGRVLDAGDGAAVAAGEVEVRWRELVVDTVGLHGRIERVRAPVGEDGRYAACGVPLDADVLVQATARAAAAGAPPASSATSGAIELRLDATTPLLHRDLLVAEAEVGTAAPVDAATPAAHIPRRGTALLAGRARRPDGAPLAGARVVLRGTGAADSTVTTGADGTFRLAALPGGTYPVDVVAIGFAPAHTAVDLRRGQTAALDLALGRRVAALEEVRVYGARIRANSEFARRQRYGFGRFLTAADIARFHPNFVGDALLHVPGLRAVTSRFGRTVIGGPRDCTPRIFVDGFAIDGTPRFPGSTGMPPADLLGDGTSAALDRIIPVKQVGGIEVYTNPLETPPQYQGCAVILVWSKAALY